MKITKLNIAALLVALGLSAGAHAEFITGTGTSLDGTDVGDPDILIDAIAGMSSGEQTEVDWVNTILGTSFEKSDMTKAEDVDWYNTTTTNVIAFMLETGPGYYLLKNAGWHILFENVIDINWGVVDLNYLLYELEIDPNLGDDMMISHIGEFGEGDTTQVPEPGTLGLFGLGLMSLGLMRRRRVPVR